ncbi:hypothetical protein ACTFIU_000088 [Dictyostelium citrinum]
MRRTSTSALHNDFKVLMLWIGLCSPTGILEVSFINSNHTDTKNSPAYLDKWVQAIIDEFHEFARAYVYHHLFQNFRGKVLSKLRNLKVFLNGKTSDIGTGCVIIQDYGSSNIRPILYDSCRFSIYQKNYSTLDREYLALIKVLAVVTC